METIHALIDAAAVAAPTRTALEFEGRKRSFAQLVTEADTIARRLQGCSLPADAVVATYFRDELDVAIVAMVGVLKARCAFVAVDPALPRSHRPW